MTALPSNPFPSGTTQKATQNTTLKSPTERIVDHLKQHPQASRKQLAEALGDISEDGVKYHLKKLQDSGRLTRIGPPRGGKWVVKEKEA